jgi:hypothetical protein
LRHKVFHLIAEALAAELFGMVTNRVRIKLAAVDRLRDRVTKRIGREVVHEQAGFVLPHGFERAAAAQRHHRSSTGLGFERNDPEVFFAWQEYDGSASVKHPDFII